MPKKRGLSRKEELRLEKLIQKKYEPSRRRHPEIRCKRVGWTTYNYEEGELYITVRFMDKTAFHIQLRPDIVINGVELSDWKTGDDKILGTSSRPWTWRVWRWRSRTCRSPRRGGRRRKGE